MRVLVVEDEIKMAALLRRGLSEEGLAVDVAGSGEDGLVRAQATDYDAIVLDVMLPGIDGFETCRRLREGGTWAPVLMLTARDAVEDRIAGLDRGADDYLTKPFEFRELLARLRALLRRSGELRPEKLAIADLVLDTGAQTAKRAGRQILLTAKEYALLEYLARNAGRVVRRAEIAEHVWDETFDPFSNLIEVYINRLRRKIDANSAKPLVHTRRGVGYVLGTAADLPSAEDADEAVSQRTRVKTPSSARKSHA